MVEADGQDTCQSREEGGKQNGHEYIGGLDGSQLGAVHHDADGNQGESRGVQHQKHDHRIAGGIFLRIQFLQSLHGFQAEWSGGIVQAEHVGGEIHENASRHWVSFGDVGEEPAEDGTEQPGEPLDDAALFANLHDAEPKRQHASQSQRNLEGGLRRTEGRLDDVGEYLGVAQKDEAKGSHGKGDEEKGNPDVVEYHKRFLKNECVFKNERPKVCRQKYE